MWEGDMLAQERDAARLAKLIEVGIALSAERDHARLMERILVEAQALCDADGGTLYLRTGDAPGTGDADGGTRTGDAGPVRRRRWHALPAHPGTHGMDASPRRHRDVPRWCRIQPPEGGGVRGTG